MDVDKLKLNFDFQRITRDVDIVEFCCGLVVIDEKTRTVRFVHYTAKGFLEGIKLTNQIFEAFEATFIMKLLRQSTDINAINEFDQTSIMI